WIKERVLRFVRHRRGARVGKSSVLNSGGEGYKAEECSGHGSRCLIGVFGIMASRATKDRAAVALGLRRLEALFSKIIGTLTSSTRTTRTSSLSKKSLIGCC